MLSEFTLLESGGYILEVVVSGDVTEEGQTAVVGYTGHLANGTSFGSGDFPFAIGSGNTIAGFELGVIGMRTRGQRRSIIPPALGYADAEQPTIPAGSVLIFDVELCTLGGLGPNPDCAD